MKDRTKTQSVFKRSKEVFPLGVTSNFRYWGEDNTLVAKRAKGAYLWDADDNRYIDYRLGFGPVILGHGPDAVDDHVNEAMRNGIIVALTTEREVRVAEMMAKLCPVVDMIRFAASGAEATMHSLRVARAYTGRDKIIKFEGAYHGMYDYVLWSTYPEPENMGSRRSPIPVQASSGIPEALHGLTITLPFNDFDLLERTFRDHGHEVAAIIVEPILGNCAGISPQPGFLERIRNLCDEHGVVFILDEVKTGFRVGPGGAQELFNIRPDLATYAKSMGAGYPVAAFGGRKEIMEIVGKGVAHAGTYTGNSVGVAAAEKTLEILADGKVLRMMADKGKQLQKGMSDILEAKGIPFVFQGHPSMFGLLFTDHEPKDYRDWATSDRTTYDHLMMAMINRGVMPDPDSREPWFLSAAHSDEDVAETLNVFEDAINDVLAVHVAA
jgi:glutamate-1-semialdehyde 2,1-aminomutase